MKWVIKYLKGTKDAKLILRNGGTHTWEEADRKSQSGVRGYSDANGNLQEHCHAISSYGVCIDGGAVLWNLRKQAIISLSTMASEYVAMGEILCPLLNSMLLYCDNQSAITVAC